MNKVNTEAEFKMSNDDLCKNERKKKYSLQKHKIMNRLNYLHRSIFWLKKKNKQTNSTQNYLSQACIGIGIADSLDDYFFCNFFMIYFFFHQKTFSRIFLYIYHNIWLKTFSVFCWLAFAQNHFHSMANTIWFRRKIHNFIIFYYLV